TTKVCEEAAQAAYQAMVNDFGNPSSLHSKGAIAAGALAEAREVMANLLRVNSGEITFTSGGSESNNMLIWGAAEALGKRVGKRMIVSAAEHPSVLEPAKHLASKGYDIQFLPVDEQGIVDLNLLATLLDRQTFLISVMQVNNETGAIQPLAEIGKMVRQLAPQALFHIDGVQAFGRLPVALEAWQADAYSLSGHKIHAPKGCGLLWLRQGWHVPAFIMGGGQERNFRSGTENVPGIVALSVAAQKICSVRQENEIKMSGVKQALLAELAAGGLKNWQINGPKAELSAPHIVNISFLEAKSEVLLHYLEQQGIYVSSGSACSSHSAKGSHVLTAMGLAPNLISSALRFSFCPTNTLQEAIIVAKAVVNAVSEIRMLMGIKRK
ncbi:MAG: cysteine desulfurase family protein, partial [Clostridiales bacterium]